MSKRLQELAQLVRRAAWRWDIDAVNAHLDEMLRVAEKTHRLAGWWFSVSVCSVVLNVALWRGENTARACGWAVVIGFVVLLWRGRPR